MRPPNRRKWFPRRASAQEIVARLGCPRAAAAYALFVSIRSLLKDTLAATRIAAALTARGIAVLRFDFTGLGGSGGDFANTNFSSNVADLAAAAAWLRAHHRAPKILIGHSLGGAAMLAAAPEIPEAVAVVTIGAPYDPGHVKHLLTPAIAEIEAAGERNDQAGGGSASRPAILHDWPPQQPEASSQTLRKALLIFLPPRDTRGASTCRAYLLAAKHPKALSPSDGGPITG